MKKKIFTLMMLLAAMATGAWADEVCSHIPGTPVQENVVYSCTEYGSYDLVVYCTLCGSELSREWKNDIMPLGHNCFEYHVSGPTCTENGYTEFKCERCGDSYTDNYIPALGHAWGTPTYVWADDYSQVSAQRICSHDASHVDSEDVLTTSEVTKEPTSTEPGEITYTATFTKYGFTPQTKVLTLHATEYETACDYYNWHGTTYTASGEYTYNTDTDVYKLNLTIHYSTSETWEREVYIGQHFEEYPFEFDVTSDTPLTQTETTTNTSGCDNVITLNLTILPGVVINETTFPDENFRTILLNYGIGTDGVLTVEEAAQIKFLDVQDKGITDLTGIEFFPELQELGCADNNISSLDVSKNPKLTFVWCSRNPLTSLNITGCTELTRLHTRDTQLTSLDLSTNTKIVEIYANNNPLNAIDVTGCPDLEWLQFPGANITTLDVSKNSKLKTLDYSENKLTSLDVSHNPLLETLSVWDGQLTTLDVSHNPNLKILYCDNNSFSELNLSNNTELEVLYCSDNQLTSLNVSGCSKLKVLRCFLNKLTTLDVSDCNALEVLNFRNNQLTTIDLSNNQALTELYLSSNKIGEAQMETIVNALPTVTDGKLVGIDTQNPDEQNVINKDQVTLAKSKGWNVQDRNGGTPVDYEGSPTAIQQVNGTQGTMRSCYTLDGRKLLDIPTKGMYILNGEKVIK